MLIKLFDIQNGKVVPSEHCYTLKSLKKIMDEYPDTYLSVYQYVFYMTSCILNACNDDQQKKHYILHCIF